LGFVNAPAIWQLVVGEVGGETIRIQPYEEKRDLLWGELTRIGYRVVKPNGAFYVFPETPLSDDVEFMKVLLDEGILAVPGTGFGRPGHMRLSLTVPRAAIERAIPGFERAFERAAASA
jgi:aspartate aminotransferase